jgi:sulfite reductase beta subunit-like hemoprotein
MQDLYLGEITFIGKASNAYNVYLRGGHNSSRMNKLYRRNTTMKRYTTETRFFFFSFTQSVSKQIIFDIDFHKL